MLDDALGSPAEPAIVGRGAATFTRQPVNPFLFYKLPSPSTSRVASASAVALKAEVPPASVPSHAASVRRPVRKLTTVQLAALETLNALGARLCTDFSAPELRREYRLIALRIHPDRHAGSSASERARLSRHFSDASDSYRRLLAILEPKH